MFTEGSTITIECFIFASKVILNEEFVCLVEHANLGNTGMN